MNYKITGIAALMVLGFIITEVSLQARQGNKQNYTNRNYDTATVETVNGIITDVTNVNTWGVHIKVQTATGVIGVHLGPDWFIKEKITLAVGDNVTATGSKVRMNGEFVIIAKTISKGSTSIQLRNDSGVPLWAGSGKGKNR